MKADETNYGNFAEPKEPRSSKRGESVVLFVIDELERAKRKIRNLERQNLKLKRRLEDCFSLLQKHEYKKLGEL